MMKRVTKTVLLTLLFVPVAIVLLFSAANAFRFAANQVAGQSQTGTIVRRLSDSGAQVLGRYTFVGNVGGKGWHTDLYSAVLVRAEGDSRDIADLVSVDAHLVVSPCTSENAKDFEEFFDFPTDTSGLFVVEATSPAPFRE